MFNNVTPIFHDRKDAGQKLAQSLKKYLDKNVIVLGMPRGGVVTAYEIADKLHAILDVIVVRKIGAPWQPEYAIGAIAPNNTVVLNQEAQDYFSLKTAEIEKLINYEKNEMEKRIRLYLDTSKKIAVQNHIVIIADDGVATGQSAIAAIRSVRKMQPQKIIFAAPVGALDAIKILKHEADEVICLEIPREFYAVGSFYENFTQTSDAEVISLLKMNHEKYFLLDK